MHRTRNDLPIEARGKSIALLNATLADAISLQLAAKQAHWNVKGPHFAALHALFDQLAGELPGAVDDIAERVVALGGAALGTVEAVARDTRLTPYPLEIHDGRQHLEALAMAFAAAGAGARKAIDVATAAGDAGTADLFTGYSRALDKALWFLEAHLQAER